MIRVYLCAMLLAWTWPAMAEEDAALMLARLCVHEAGFLGHQTGDCDGIYSVVRRVGKGNIMRGIETYSRRFFNSLTSRRWVHLLGSGNTMQMRSGENLFGTMQAYRRWDALLRHCSGLIRGLHKPICTPDHWGMRYGNDKARATRAGWKEVHCGHSLNAFWKM